MGRGQDKPRTATTAAPQDEPPNGDLLLSAGAQRPPRGPPQRRHRRPRRPRQDDARRRDAVADRRVPGQPGRRRAGHGLDGPRAREGHHDPRQEHRGPLRRRQAQHRRHARPRRLRRRGRARPDDGRRRAAARRRQRGPAAADALRAAQGARGAPARHPRRQQGRPARRAHRRGRRRGLRAVPRPRRRRGPDRVPDRLLQRQGRPRVARREATPTSGESLAPLLDLLVEHIPAPEHEDGHPLQAHVTNLDASPYVGRLALCRVHNGTIKRGQRIAWCRADGSVESAPGRRAVRDRGARPRRGRGGRARARSSPSPASPR